MTYPIENPQAPNWVSRCFRDNTEITAKLPDYQCTLSITKTRMKQILGSFCRLFHAGFLLGSLFTLEDGGNTFLRNVG
jgi:hypothetical protein